MKTYPAKLLLFGEHTVNLGSQALAIPLALFSGRWRFLPENTAAERERRQLQLPAFAAYLEQLQQKQTSFIQLDLGALYQDLSRGLFFESNIPGGYGVGSSGALVAAIFDRYGLVREGRDLIVLKRAFAQMESFFHGTSSGTDPLVCYLQQPLLLGKKQGVQPVDLPEAQFSATLFLLDTGIGRVATPLIEYFLEKSRDRIFGEKCENQLLPAVDKAVAAFLSGDWEVLFEQVHLIGAFQLANLEKLIPEAYRAIWKAGLAGDYFKLKVCGAGGGGFILGVTKDFARLQVAYPEYTLLEVTLA